MPVDEYRAAAAAAMTELLDDSAPVPTDEVMARFRASEAAEEDTTRRILALLRLLCNSIEEEPRGGFFCGWKNFVKVRRGISKRGKYLQFG